MCWTNDNTSYGPVFFSIDRYIESGSVTLVLFINWAWVANSDEPNKTFTWDMADEAGISVCDNRFHHWQERVEKFPTIDDAKAAAAQWIHEQPSVVQDAFNKWQPVPV